MGKVKTGRVTRSKQTIQSFERECKCKFHNVFAKQGKCRIFNVNSKDYKKLHLRWLISKRYMTVKSKYVW